jgi:hypothetical protein
MKFGPTPTGGRISQGDTPWGKYRVEWDAAGKLISAECTPAEPPKPPPADPRLPRVEDQFNRCRGCGDH